MKRFFLIAFFLTILNLMGSSAFGQLQVFNVLPNATDPQIDQALEVHYAAINRTVTPKNQLMLFFPGTGGIPRGYKTFTELAANKGFHAIALQYVNLDSVNTLCGGANTDLDCYERCRLEIIDGTDRTTLVNVNRPNSIENRLVKLLKYMNANFPNDGWLQYIDSNDNIRWEKLVVAGHSQGGGHAGILGKKHRVARVIMFASADYNVSALAPANWITAPGLTPNSDFYGFIHQRDQFFNYSVLVNQVWSVYGMLAFGSPVNVDNIVTPFNNSHTLNSDWATLPIGSDYHSSTIVDTRFPVSNGEPLYKSAWEYLLNTPKLKNVFDFDGDGKTDISIFRPNSGEWWLNRSSSGQTIAFQFGQSTDKLVPGDFTGDGKTDVALWRPSNGFWYVLRSEDNSFFSFPFGTNGDIPVVEDFDADGKADVGVFRPSTNEWFISKSSGGTSIITFGISGDLPVVADYDGDGKADIAIYRPSVGQWWISRSSNNSVYAFQFGTSADKPVQGDYTGDGKQDAAFFRPSTGEWFILRSEDSSFYSVPFGTSGDLPAPGDYDGDDKFDTAVFRPSNNTWYVNRSTAGVLITGFGISGDKPLPNVFVP
jgi:hypothetical protein